MSSETARLRANAEDQIARLLTQLADLEEAKEVRTRVSDANRIRRDE